MQEKGKPVRQGDGFYVEQDKRTVPMSFLWRNLMNRGNVNVPDFSGSTGKGHPVPGNMPTRDEALKKFFAVWKPETGKEMVDIADAAGRIAAEDIVSEVTLPIARTAGLDGIAVHSADFAGGRVPDVSSWIPGKDYVRADTGDDFPDDFDAIIMVEWLRFDESGRLSEICFPDAGSASGHRPGPGGPGFPGGKPGEIRPGSYTRPAGSIIRKGDLLVRKNEKIRPTDLAALAMGNVTQIPVWKKPVVAFLPTGSELIEPGNAPARGQNINTNSLLVKHMVQEMGAEVAIYPIMKDDRDALEDWLDMAVRTADIVLINGGSSKGSEDYNIRLIEEKGTVIQHNVAAVPGRPVALALIDGKAVIDLPGPTLAAYFVCDWCIRALVAHSLHQNPDGKEEITGILKEDLPKGGPVQIIHRLNVRKEADGSFGIYPLEREKASSAAIMNSNAQYVTELFEEGHPAGSELTVELLRNRENL